MVATKRMTLADAIDIQTDSAQKIQDIRGSLYDFEPAVEQDTFVVRHRTSGRTYKPTEHALRGMARWANTSDWFVQSLTEKCEKAGKVIYNRDGRDAELLKHTFQTLLWQPDRIDTSKQFLFRTWNDGTLRAVLSDRYAIVNNLAVLEAVREVVPDAEVSHWRGDADTLYGNIVIPNTVRSVQDDSDYGAGVSISNSEIGLRRVGSAPYILRLVCTNGMIMAKYVSRVSRVHRGSLDWNQLKLELQTDIKEHLNLADQLIDSVLGLKAYGCGDTPMVKAFGQLAKTHKIAKKHAMGIFKAFDVEAGNLPEGHAKSLFGMQQAITRYSQTIDNQNEWVTFDELAGTMMDMTQDKWQRFTAQAKSLDVEELEDIFGMAV